MYYQIVALKLPPEKVDHQFKCPNQLNQNFFVVGDHNLNLRSAAELTGNFIKYYVSMNENSDEDREPESEIRADAFHVMMSAFRNLPILPPSTTVRNRKDKLYNDIRSFVQTSSLCWRSSEVSSGTAAGCVSTLRDAVLYIDGMHDTLNERRCQVPAVFERFVGYNTLEQHKQRKRVCHSMSRDELLSLSKALFGCLSHPFWSRSMWLPRKKDVKQLSRSLASYAEMLLDKRA